MSNLYEILEVSEKASKEVIDKAYHVLAKKYHPDLQSTVEKKKLAEAKMQKINEAYDILGNEQKRKIYDLKLEQEIEEQKRKEKQEQLKEFTKYVGTSQYRGDSLYGSIKNQINNVPSEKENLQNLGKGIFGAYRQAYNDYWEKRAKKERRPWTKNRVLDILKGIGIFIIIIIVLLLFPPTNKLIVGFYEDNPAIKAVVDILGKIILGIINGIITFLKNLLQIES